MIILTSPSKSLDLESSYREHIVTQPVFLSQTSFLHRELVNFTQGQLKKLLKVSDSLAELNYNRYQSWKQNHNLSNSRPALFTFNGDVFKELELQNYEHKEHMYAQKSLRILSGFYGIVRALDLIQPYRLEMGTIFQQKSVGKLSDYWKNSITNHINEELALDDHTGILNLASKEYSSAIDSKNLVKPMYTVVFKQKRKGVFKTFGILAKRARGKMIDYCIQNNVSTIDEVRQFTASGYKYSPDESSDTILTFKQQITPIT